MNNKVHPQKTYLNFFLFLLLALVWSASFINIKIVVDALPPIFSAMVRVLISMICIGTVFAVTKKKVFMPSFKYWRLWLTGFFTQALPFALLFYGEKFIAPALASIINSTVSLWALLLGTLLFRDFSQWTPMKLAGLMIGFAGIILIFLPMINQGENSMIGVVAIMGMAVSYAIGGLMNQHMIFNNLKTSFETNLFQQHLSSILFLIITSLSLETWPSIGTLLDTKIILAFLYLGIMATALGWMIYFYLIREWGAVSASSVMYIVPVLAIVWDLLFLHSIPTRNELIGTAAILVGVTLIQWVRKPRIEKVVPANL